MKTLFISTKLKSRIEESKIKEISKELPKNIALTYSIQYQEQAKKIKQILSKNHRVLKFIQVLGCTKLKLPENTQAILLISDGKFHATSLALESELPVYLFNLNKLEKISNQDIENLKKKQKASFVKYLNSETIGIIISTKPGQSNFKKATELKKKEKKQAYLFISNNIDTREFENFGLDFWVNTACPRMDMASNSIINIDKLNM